MINQIFHQNKANRNELKFLAQKDINNQEEASSWLKDIKKRYPPPNGWEYLICGQGSEHFLWAVEE